MQRLSAPGNAQAAFTTQRSTFPLPTGTWRQSSFWGKCKASGTTKMDEELPGDVLIKTKQSITAQTTQTSCQLRNRIVIAAKCGSASYWIMGCTSSLLLHFGLVSVKQIQRVRFHTYTTVKPDENQIFQVQFFFYNWRFIYSEIGVHLKNPQSDPVWRDIFMLVPVSLQSGCNSHQLRALVHVIAVCFWKDASNCFQDHL